MHAPYDSGAAAALVRPRTTIDSDGTVEGYASLFGEIDAARDMVMPGTSPRSTSRARSSTSAACRCWRTKCATLESMGCHPAARPTASMRWCGQ
jgi:hypothetical protein